MPKTVIQPFPFSPLRFAHEIKHLRSESCRLHKGEGEFTSIFVRLTTPSGTIINWFSLTSFTISTTMTFAVLLT